ncbi:MAG: FtsL-like putative cell division protein [Cytophagales bacterium]|nr:FtsL-like putative cell division protein [Cytophagales bacterium]
MRENLFREEPQKEPERSGLMKVFQELGTPLEAFPTRYLFKAIFTVIIGILYIGNKHHVNKLIREVERTRTEVEDLRAEYMHTRMHYSRLKSRKSILKRARAIGLIEPEVPPLIIPDNTEQEQP